MNWFQRIFSFGNGNEEKPPLPRVTTMPQPASKGIPQRGKTGLEAVLGTEITNTGDFYAYLRRRIPTISNGISAWTELSSHGATVNFSETSDREQKRATNIIDALDERVHEHNFSGGDGLNKLLNLFYTTLYLFGRAAFEIVPYQDLSGIAYVAYVDPFSIVLKSDGQRIRIFQRQEKKNVQEELLELPPSRVFYAPFDPDGQNPQGVSLLDSINWVTEIKEKLIEDMARASHNTGYARLHVAINQPEQLPGESVIDYISRINNNFDETVDEFRDLDVTDNVFTWGYVNVSLIGQGNTQGFSWSINLDRINDEVAAGLRLPQWVLGISTATTKNWVGAQQDLLMQRVGRGSGHGSRFLDWIRNTELRMRGNKVRTTQSFKGIDNPGILIQERAKGFQFKRVDDMVTRGYISKDDGARELGLKKAFDSGEGGERRND